MKIQGPLQELQMHFTPESPLQSFQQYFKESPMIMSLTVKGVIFHGRRLEVIKQCSYFPYDNVHMKLSPETEGEIL